MIPAAVDYVRADSAEAAIAALAEAGDEAKLLAGGQSLIPLMKLRLAAPSVLVDVGRAADLSGISVDGDTVSIGALTTHSTLEHSTDLAAACPLLAHVASQVGDPAVRHRGTLGGSLAHGDPASDLPATLIALGGSLVVDGPSGRREVSADDFFTGFLETDLADDEMRLTAEQVEDVEALVATANPYSAPAARLRALFPATEPAEVNGNLSEIPNSSPAPAEPAEEETKAEGPSKFRKGDVEIQAMRVTPSNSIDVVNWVNGRPDAWREGYDQLNVEFLGFFHFVYL